VNRKKSTTGSPTKLKFLGFSLYKTKGNVGIRAHEKSLTRLKSKLKDITSRKRRGTIEQILQELTRAINGWLGYYSIADVKKYLKELSEVIIRYFSQSMSYLQTNNSQFIKSRKLFRL
jgi:hypothetical protein